MAKLPDLTDSFLAAGEPPNTPFDAVEGGRLLDQRLVRTALAGAAAAAQHLGVTVPAHAVMMSGRVAALARDRGPRQ